MHAVTHLSESGRFGTPMVNVRRNSTGLVGGSVPVHDELVPCQQRCSLARHLPL